MTTFQSSPNLEDERSLRQILEEHLEDEDWDGIKKAVSELPAPDVADALGELDREDRHTTFRALPRRLGAKVLSFFSPDRVHRLLEALDDHERREVLRHIEPDDRTQLLETLPEEASSEVMQWLDEESGREARELLEYPAESVGRLMTTNSLVLRPGWTVKEALDHVRSHSKESEIVSLLFVVDHQGELVDTVNLRTLIMADRETLVEQHVDRSYVALSPYDDREQALQALQDYDSVALPVVDEKGVFRGLVTADDVMDVAQEEFTEDFQQYGAVQPLERSYSASSLPRLFKSRIGWLLILIFVNLISSGVIAYFEDTLAEMIALAFFIPLLIGSGGNTGAQAATLMVRAIATGNVPLSDWFKAFYKEIGVGLALATTMGFASIFLGLFRGDWTLGFIVGLSMAGIVMIANILGTLLPFLLTRLGIDPAVASSPLITTIVDAVGLFIYFGIATLFLASGYVPV